MALGIPITNLKSQFLKKRGSGLGIKDSIVLLNGFDNHQPHVNLYFCVHASIIISFSEQNSGYINKINKMVK